MPQQPTEHPKSIEHQFQKFRKIVFPGDHSKRVIQQIRQCYFAGALDTIMTLPSCSPEQGARLVQEIVSACNELAGQETGIGPQNRN